MNPAALDRPPVRPAAEPASRARPPQSERDDFERLLDEQEQAPSERSPEPAAGWPQAAQPTTGTEPGTSGLPERAEAGVAPLRLAASLGEPAPPPPIATSAGDQAALAARLDTPLRAPGEAARFDLLSPTASAGVSSVELRPLASGGIGVTVVTGAEQAQLLDRHVPLLQRRLGAKGSAHLRVDGQADGRR